MTLPPTTNDVAAVVSAYAPTEDLIQNIAWLKGYVDHVVVVDDGSPNNVDDVLAGIEELGATIVRLAENSGIAAALNAGIRHARALWAPEWLITMDQDSRFTGDYVAAALETARKSYRPETVGVVAAQFHNGIRMPILRDDLEPEVFDPMQSGTLIKSSVLDAVGYLDESLFIDCVDSDFNARIRKAGFRALAGIGCNLEHSLGNARPLRILGWHARIGTKRLNVHYHSPFRVYYITRNSAVMVRRYIRDQPRWVIRRIYMEFQSHAVRFVYGPDRRKHAVAFFYGLRDALTHRMGKIRPNLAERLK